MARDSSSHGALEQYKLNRRKILGASALALSSGIAGCGGGGGGTDTATQGGDGGGDGDGGTPTSGGDGDGGTPTSGGDGDGGTPTDTGLGAAVEPKFDFPESENFAQQQGNPYGSQFPTGLNNIASEQLAGVDYKAGKVIPNVITDFRIEGKDLIYEFGKDHGITWHNGKPLKPRDLLIKYRIDRLLRAPDTRTFETEKVDGNKLIRTAKSSINPLSAIYSYIPTSLAVNRFHRFDEYMGSLEDASTQKERNEIGKQLKNYSIPLEEYFGTGLYELDTFSADQAVLKKYEDHPRANQTNIETFRLVTSQQAVREQLFVNGKLDSAYNGVPATIKKQMPDWWKEFTSYSSGFMQKIIIDHSNKHLQHRGVRQAMISAINFNDLAKNLGGPEVPVDKLQTGVTTSSEKTWIPNRDKYIDWPNATDQEMADKQLEKAGYTRENGKVKDPDGNRVKITYKGPTWWDTATRTIGSQLNEYGFKVNLQVQEPSVWGNDRKKGNFDMIAWYHTGGPFPGGKFRLGPASGLIPTPAAELEGKDRSPALNIPLKPTIPSELGATEVSGSGKEIDIVELASRFQGNTPRKKQAEAIKLLTRWWNFDIPHLSYVENVRSLAGDSKNFNWNTDSPWATSKRPWKDMVAMTETVGVEK